MLTEVRPLAFDGNHGDFVTRWLFPLPGTVEMEEDAIDQLMELTVEEPTLSWVLFPPGAFRL